MNLLGIPYHQGFYINYIFTLVVCEPTRYIDAHKLGRGIFQSKKDGENL